MSKSVTYVGPAEVNVQLEVGRYVNVRPGGTVELPDDIADELVERGEALHASTTSDSGAPPQSATKEEWAAFRAAQGHDVDGLTKHDLIDLPDTPEG